MKAEKAAAMAARKTSKDGRKLRHQVTAKKHGWSGKKHLECRPEPTSLRLRIGPTRGCRCPEHSGAHIAAPRLLFERLAAQARQTSDSWITTAGLDGTDSIRDRQIQNVKVSSVRRASQQSDCAHEEGLAMSGRFVGRCCARLRCVNSQHYATGGWRPFRANRATFGVPWVN